MHSHNRSGKGILTGKQSDLTNNGTPVGSDAEWWFSSDQSGEPSREGSGVTSCLDFRPICKWQSITNNASGMHATDPPVKIGSHSTPYAGGIHTQKLREFTTSFQAAV
jgi:hypothetical protein